MGWGGSEWTSEGGMNPFGEGGSVFFFFLFIVFAGNQMELK